MVRLEDGYVHDLLCYVHSLSPTWSPDGSVIAYDSDFGIHLTNEERTIGDVTDDRSPFAISTDSRDITPVWSPDGSKIAFGHSQHDHWEIYLMDADGSNQRPMLVLSPSALLRVDSVEGFEKAPSTTPFDSAQGELRTGLDGLEFEYGFVAERMVSWTK